MLPSYPKHVRYIPTEVKSETNVAHIWLSHISYFCSTTKTWFFRSNKLPCPHRQKQTLVTVVHAIFMAWSMTHSPFGVGYSTDAKDPASMCILHDILILHEGNNGSTFILWKTWALFSIKPWSHNTYWRWAISLRLHFPENPGVTSQFLR